MPLATGYGDVADRRSGRLRLDVIGSFSASVDGREVKLSRKARALLGYMILSSTRQLPRAKLVGLLWSEKDEALAKGSLRQSLSEIQRELKEVGCQQFSADQLTVTFDIDDVTCDAIEVVAEAERGIVNPQLLVRERLTSVVLDDVESVDPVFSEWLTEARTAFHQRLLDALTTLLPAEEQMTVSSTAQAAAKAMYRLDGEDERAVRVLIKAHAAAGNIGAALALYARLWRQLEDAYDVEPHQLTQDLIARLRQQQPETVAPPVLRTAIAGGAGVQAGRPSVAVLPFVALSPNLEPQYAIGIADSLVQALSTLKELFVISRASTMITMAPSLDFRAIGRELNASYLQYGSIQRSGDQIRITSELIASETGEVVRADRLSGSIADLFDLQDRLAVEVIRSLAPQVRDRELNRAMQKRPDDLDAYQLALIGYEQMFKPDYTTFATARTNFERAHALAPAWAPPLSYSAIWHMQRVSRGWSADSRAELETARSLAEQAMERDSADGLANAVSAYTLSHCRLDHAGALLKLDRTIEITPNLALAFAFRAGVHVRCEQYHEALLDASMNLRLSPRDRNAWFADMIAAQAHFALHDLAAAIDAALRVVAVLPGNQANLRILVSALVESDRLDEAMRYTQPLVKGDEIDLAWMGLSPWPRSMLVRIEKALLQCRLR